jgi:hypothetical protein
MLQGNVTPLHSLLFFLTQWYEVRELARSLITLTIISFGLGNRAMKWKDQGFDRILDE